MKFTLVCLFAVAAVTLARPESTYTDKFDNINIPEILQNDRLLTAYVKCLLDKGKCTPEGNELKKNMGDALATGCSKCTEAQREGTKTVLKYLINNKPEIWNEVKAKFDPQGVYAKKYEKELKSIAN